MIEFFMKYVALWAEDKSVTIEQAITFVLG